MYKTIYCTLLLCFCTLSVCSCSVLCAETLSEFGAVGDGSTDDFLALKKAIRSDAKVLDGEGKRYRVIGTLEVQRDLILKNMTLLQGPEKVTSEMKTETDPQFSQRLRTRTLMFRSPPSKPKLKIHLDNITIHRGSEETQGLPSDSAGLWIVDSEGSLKNVTITGNGHGNGIILVRCSKLTLDQIHIHDMIWKPWESKPQLDYKTVSENWNGIPYWTLSTSTQGEEVFPNTFFAWERIQEQLVGISITHSKSIRISNSVIERLRARFADGRLIPYQSDGITVGSYCSDIHFENLKVGQVWEGIDLTGNPLNGVVVKNCEVVDAHAFGFKMANGACDVLLDKTHALRCGLSGYVVSGKNLVTHTGPASSRIVINNSLSENSGANGYWKNHATIAGYRIMTGRVQQPFDVLIKNSQAIDNQQTKTMQFGFHEERPGTPKNSLMNVRSSGHLEQEKRGF